MKGVCGESFNFLLKSSVFLVFVRVFKFFFVSGLLLWELYLFTHSMICLCSHGLTVGLDNCSHEQYRINNMPVPMKHKPTQKEQNA